MQAAHMTFEEEVIKSRSELKHLRLENARLKRTNDLLSKKVLHLEHENRRLHKENHLLKQQQKILITTQRQQEKQIESLKLIVEQLRTMVFGRKKKDGDNNSSKNTNTNNNDKNGEQTKGRESANRAPDSYRRAAPEDIEVTDVYEHQLTNCPDCGTLLIKLKQIIRYIEDIADLTNLSKLLKRIEKHIIGSGYCPKCKKRKIAHEITPQVSILGENVGKLIAYLSVVMRLSFEQVRCFLKDTVDLKLSDGELTVCLDGQADKLVPEKNRLLQKIRGTPGRHYDETTWKVQNGGQGNYAWVNRGTEGEETVFLMGRSRGKGNAEELQGVVDNQVGISDDYGAYQKMFAKHQLCMSHPKRKLRDLANSETISGKSKQACVKSYGEFSVLYHDLEETLKTEYQKDVWLQKRKGYIKRLKEIAVITGDDPQKLKAVKLGLKENAKKYFTCLLQSGIPADNNKAERGLRHIVLKRKISYGSKSQKGADTMAILCSTLLSTWWNKPKNFFVAYNQMLTV